MRNIELVDRVQEITEGLASRTALRRRVTSGTAILMKASGSPIAVGEGLLVKVNTNLGVSSRRLLEAERAKLHSVATAGFRPDTMMDHTIVKLPGRQFYELMLSEFGGPIGTLPHYLAFHPRRGIERSALLDMAQAQAEAGVSFMTLHPTPTTALVEKARRLRVTASTSRGGGVVIRDMAIHRRHENVIAECFTDLLSILQKHGMALSIGSVFRPSSLSEALDDVHREETAVQFSFIAEARRAGVPVQMEGIGHIALTRLPRYLRLVKRYGVPLMPLGPLPTDASSGMDHVANAIGAAYVCLLGGAHIINSITREEHTGGVPTEPSVLEGLKAARIAAHAVNLCRFQAVAKLDAEVAALRALRRTCAVDIGLFSRSARQSHAVGCTRCGPECPLVVTVENPT